MTKIKTAREILEENHFNEGLTVDEPCSYDISEDSMIEFGVKPRQLEHEEMEKKGVYRKFLA